MEENMPKEPERKPFVDAKQKADASVNVRLLTQEQFDALKKAQEEAKK